jgi:hypothetical protein
VKEHAAWVMLTVTLLAAPAMAEPDKGVMPEATIEAHVPWYHHLPLSLPFLSRIEFVLRIRIDSHSANFSLLKFKCDYLDDDHRRQGSVMGSISRSEFKPVENGKLLAERTLFINPDNPNVECRIMDVRK